MSGTSKTVRKRHIINPESGKATQFKKDRQPTGKNKSLGWQKKKFTREVMREFLQSNFNLSPQMKQQFAEKFGIDPNDKVAMGAAIMMQQAMASMGGGVTAKQAADFLFSQALGAPKQEVDVTTGGQPIKQNVIKLSDGTTISI